MTDDKLVEAVARAIAAAILAQDYMADEPSGGWSTIVDWLDQGETDFSLAATAAIEAMRVYMADDCK